MKHIKKYKKHNLQSLKYKEGDIVGYKRYLNQQTIPVIILSTTESSTYPYFIEEIKRQSVHTATREEIVDLTPEQIEEIRLYLNLKKYNI